MKFQDDVTGVFNNVVGLAVAQNFYINVRCTQCGADYKNLLYITDEMKEQVRVKGNQHELETYNLVVGCKSCNNEMHIRLHKPTETKTVELRDELKEEPGKMEVFPIKNSACHISTVQSDSAVLTNVDGLILDAVDSDGKVYENCEFKNRVLVEDAKNGKTVDIQGFKISIREL